MKKIVCLVLLSAFAFAGCGKNYLAEKEFYKAEQLLKGLNLSQSLEPLDQAVSAFRAVADRYPGTPKALESLRLISNMRLKQRRYEEAREALVEVIQSFAASQDAIADARYRIGEIYEIEEKWSDAEKIFWELSEASPLHGKGLYAPIKILLNYRRTKDDKGFERAYVKALDHYEDLLKQVGPIEAAAPVRNFLGVAQMIKGDHPAALATWLSIPLDFPKSPQASMSILAAAELNWKDNEFEKSEALYERFFTEYPGHPLTGRTAMTLGLAYQSKGDFAKARDWYNKALVSGYKEKSPEQAELKLLIARSYQDELLWDEAEALYKEIELGYPNSSAMLQVPLMRADHFNEVGETAQAVDILDKAIRHYEVLESTSKDPKVVSYAQRFRSQALARKGAWKEIVDDIDKRMSEETTPVRKGRWLFLKALMTQNRLKDNAKAIELFESFLNLYPGHPLEARAKSQLELLKKPA